MLSGKKIILGITGSIAAYKAILIVRLLVKAGAEVKVVITPAARDFVSSLTLSTLSKSAVLQDLSDELVWANHVALGRWADIMLIAPLSCNTLSKMAQGVCDNLLQAIYLSATCPVIVAPAMDEDMWRHAATKENLKKIKSYGCKLIPVENGELASGLVGEGRMAEPEVIIQYVKDQFVSHSQWKGKKVLVTAGPTYEPIDPVRFIGNHSSGKMGYAIAEEFAKRGAEVVLITGPVSLTPSANISRVIKVQTANEMYEASVKNFNDYSVMLLSAAVADYSALEVAATKIKKTDEDLSISLKKTKDILASLGALKKNEQVLVGFALETDNERENALKKLQNKNADMIILNSMNDEAAGFKKDTNKITIFQRNGTEKSFEAKSKTEVAKDIIDAIAILYNEKTTFST